MTGAKRVNSASNDADDHYELGPAFAATLHQIIEDVRAHQSLDSFSEDQLNSVLDAAIEVLKPLPALINVDIPATIFGDIHGHLSDLLLLLHHAPSKAQMLFLGDYADRSAKGLEVLFLLLSIKLLEPKRVHLLRGNHETSGVSSRYGLLKECRHKFSVGMWNKLRLLFFELPLCARVGHRILAMHGGISPSINSWSNLTQLEKPRTVAAEEERPCVDLLWADPNPSHTAMPFVFNWARGCSVMFGPQPVEELLKKLDIDLIVRAHEVPSRDQRVMMGGKLCTVFSAMCYQGDDNPASVAHVSSSLQVSFTVLKPFWGCGDLLSSSLDWSSISSANSEDIHL